MLNYLVINEYVRELIEEYDVWIMNEFVFVKVLLGGN